MNKQQIFRVIVGTMILGSLALAHWVDNRWLFFTVFIGANMLQSAFTRWCLLDTILSKAGAKP